MEWQDKIAIADYGVMAVLFLIGIVACVKAYLQPGLIRDAQRLVLGIGLICTWGLMHQTFWFSRWVLYANGDGRTQWFLDNSWMLMGLYFLAFIGAIEVAYSLFRSRCFLASQAERAGTWVQGWFVWAIGIMLLWISIYSIIPGR